MGRVSRACLLVVSAVLALAASAAGAREVRVGVYDNPPKLLLDKRDGLIALAEKLLEKEILFQTDLEEILGKRPFDHRTTYDEFVNGENEGDQRQAAEGLVHDGVGDNSGTFENKPSEGDSSQSQSQ